MVAGPSTDLHLLLRGGEAVHSLSSGKHRQGVPRHPPKLKGERPVEEHDEHTVDPLEDGGGVLQDKALLAKENSAW